MTRCTPGCKSGGCDSRREVDPRLPYTIHAAGSSSRKRSFFRVSCVKECMCSARSLMHRGCSLDSSKHPPFLSQPYRHPPFPRFKPQALTPRKQVLRTLKITADAKNTMSRYLMPRATTYPPANHQKSDHAARATIRFFLRPAKHTRTDHEHRQS